METYTINENLKIEAEYYKTRHNWGHKARAIYQGREVANTKIVYQNRTWESYRYQSVMQKLINAMDECKTIPLSDRIEASQKIKIGDGRDMAKLRSVGALAMLGGIIGGNESKARILNTIPGLDIDALDGLDEKTKTERLDGAINILMTK